jgi:hypothetical protein
VVISFLFAAGFRYALEVMTLMDAQQYDPARDRRRRKLIIVIIIAALIGAWVAYHVRDYPERAIVRKFFADLQKQDYEAAYSVWFQDLNWKQHPSKYPNYSFSDFYRDWGPGGEWGLIKSYHVDCSLSPGGGSGVIVQVMVNQRADHAYVWVQKSDQTLSFSPNEIECGNWWTWLTE